MKLSYGSLLLVPTLFIAHPARADLELPQPSPAAKVMQTVGLTEIEVEYSSPAARGREVWGKLVPYDQHWRTGANRNTLIRFSGPVEIGGQKIEAGEYSLHSIPGKISWTLIVNTKTTGTGSGNYDEKQDVARVKAQALSGPKRERLTFVFADTTRSSTRLDLEWAGVKVGLPISVATDAAVDKAIERMASGLWREPAAAARYLVDNKLDLDRAHKLATRSLELASTWYGQMVLGMVLEAKKDTKGAIAATEKALTMGDESGAFKFYEGEMKKKLAVWKK
ncbi:MAG: DUF2911 domain-containing protein [Myxococcota bacterium]